MTTVLVVEDELQIRQTLAISIRASGYEVTTAGTAAEALDAAGRHPPDLVVLDLGLPDQDGIHVIRELRTWSDVPIIVLSGRTGSSEKVSALDAGADDYVTKPFGTQELLARLRSAERRRARGQERNARINLGTLAIDLGARTVTSTTDDSPLQLTPTEWEVLEILARNPGRLITHAELATRIWDKNRTEAGDSLRAYLARLRRKLEPDPSRPRYLLTEPGMGYRFQP